MAGVLPICPVKSVTDVIGLYQPEVFRKMESGGIRAAAKEI
jgi:hypothetical protein